MAQPERLNMAEIAPPEAASIVQTQASKALAQTELRPGQRTSPFSAEYDPTRVDYIVSREGDSVVIRDPRLVDPETNEYKVVGLLPGIAGGEEKPEESPVPGLTAEDVALFKQNGTTAEQLNEIIKQHGLEGFLTQARKKLEEFREEAKTALTPEQLAEKQAKERAEKIAQLQAERESLQGASADTPRKRTLLALSRFRINAELENLGAGGTGGGRVEGPGSEEGEPIPPDIDLEYEASPEKGRQIARDIMEQTAKLYAGKLEDVDWPKLNQAYLDQRIHTEACRLVKAKIHVRPAEAPDTSTVMQNPNVDINRFYGLDENGENRHFRPLAEWINEHSKGEITDEKRFREEIDGYFAEARRVGLLRDLDIKLANAHRKVRQGIKRGQTSDEILYETPEGRPGIDHEINNALKAIGRVYLNRVRTDAGIRNLMGAGELYAQMAVNRFADIISNNDPEAFTQEGTYLDNEFHLSQTEGFQQETFWKATHGWYIEVSAQTPDEFEIAADSYISTLESITSDPKEILDQSQQFIRVLTQSDGAQKLLQTEEGKTFISRLAFRIQARVAIFGADDANERYQNDNYKAYMDYENKDGKGPDRYLELVKYLDGLPAGVLWALDNDPRWEILFSLYGPRGQLSDASPSQKARDGSSLYEQLYELLVEEMLGVAIKNKKNLGNLTKFTSDEDFANNFNGLYRYNPNRKQADYGDVNRRAYQEALKQDPERLNKIQIELHSLRDKIIKGEKLTKPDGKPYDPSKDEIYELLADPVDVKFYKSTLMRDKRVRLGKIQVELDGLRKRITEGENFILKDKKDENGEYERYDPSSDEIYELLADSSDAKFYKSELAKVKKAVDIALQIYGALGEKSKRGGGVFKTDKKVDAQGREFQYFVPVHLAEKFVQCGVTLTKIKYADDAPIWDGYEKWDYAIAQKIRAENEAEKRPPLWNFKAKYRTAKVLEAERTAIADFKKNGYEAKLYYVDYDSKGKETVGSRQVMTLKRPKEDPKTGEVIKDTNGNVIVEEVPVDFYIATHHIYGNWSGHTYWSYQEEDRHMVLSDVTFAKARAIRDGKKRPQDTDMWAEQLLILDPTLKRVRRFTKNFEDRERKLTMAAVEDSYQGHERIGVGLYEAFFPKHGTPANEIGIYYGLQDFGGFRKMVEHARARAAEDPERFARRGRRLIPYLRIPVSPLSEYLGQGTRGALGAIMMLDAPIYRGAGTLALDKFHAQAELAFKLYEALFIASKDEQGNIIEPLLLKLTNESDTNLQEFFQKLPALGKGWWSNPAAQQEFCVAVRKSFGRLERYEKLLSTIETQVRNASGAQLLEKVDILTDDGKLEVEVERAFRALPDINTQDLTRADLARFVQQAEEILTISEDEFNEKFNRGVDDDKNPVTPGIDEGDISVNTGSGRHGARRFHYKFFEVFLDEGKRGGFRLYPTERFIYKHLRDKIAYIFPEGKSGIAFRDDDIIDWLFSKFVPT